MNRKPYTPTRTCPHRWCKPVHLAPIPFGLAVFAFDLWHNWQAIIMVVVMASGGYWLPRIVHYRRTHRSKPATVRDIVDDIRSSPTAIQLEMEDLKYAGTGWRTLHVRKGWARVAVGCDILLAAIVGIGASATFSNPVAAAASAESKTFDAGAIVGAIIALSFVAFLLWAHKKATQPRKPKRATVPAALQTNT